MHTAQITIDLISLHPDAQTNIEAEGPYTQYT